MKNKIAIIMGESTSINSEIIAKSWNKLKNKKKFFIIGSFDLMEKQLSQLKIKITLKRSLDMNAKLSSKALHVLDVPVKFKNPFNLNKTENAKYVTKCLDIGDQLAKKKKILGLINCPINKKKIPALKKLGVTEYLAKKKGKNTGEVMMIYNSFFAVVPLTTHINIKDVSNYISKKLINKKLISLNKFYIKVFKKKPIISVLGLNPHNDEYRISSEEHRIIIPSIKRLKKKGLKISGPYPADTIFSQKQKYNFDVIVGMYHDQVLAPFKAMFKYNAINITLGLDYLRASPDHGVAEDMVKKNKADPTSLIKCINFISRIK